MAAPTVTTRAISGITITTASGGGNVTSNGGGTIIHRGVAWNTSSGATTGNSHTTQTGDTGTFISPITGLSGNTKYYVRAYATNTGGTSYGSNVNFTTLAPLPIVTTRAVSGITVTTAIGGGIVSGALITARGLAFGITTGPTTGDSIVLVTGTTGSFSSLLTGLIVNTKYYIRAFAVNNDGIAYGNEINFTTILVPNQYTSTGYDFFEKTGIGDGAAYQAFLDFLTAQSIIHEEP